MNREMAAAHLERNFNKTDLFRFKVWEPGSVADQFGSSIIYAIPAELRPNIWKQLIGGRVLHPTQHCSGKWMYRGCVNDRGPQELYELSLTPDNTVPTLEGFERDTADFNWVEKSDADKHTLVKAVRSAAFGHHECRGRLDHQTDRTIGFVRRTDPNFSKDLAILRSCKIFHDEALQAFWSNNVFSFWDKNVWNMFMESLRGPEKGLIKIIDFSLHTGELLTPTRGHPALFLGNLKVLHLHLQDSLCSAFHPSRLPGTVAAIQAMLGQTQLSDVRITVIVDNSDHSHCQCEPRWQTTPPPKSSPLNQRECLDTADILARELKAGGGQPGPPRARYFKLNSDVARIPTSTNREMYVCEEGSTAKECKAMYQSRLEDLMGSKCEMGVQPCGARHRCLICRNREGVTLLYGAPYHCEKPGNCNEPGGYQNRNVMPISSCD